jgi:hypothetical protein
MTLALVGFASQGQKSLLKPSYILSCGQMLVTVRAMLKIMRCRMLNAPLSCETYMAVTNNPSYTYRALAVLLPILALLSQVAATSS